MSAAQDFELPKDVIFPPGDLYSNEPPLESELHLGQLIPTPEEFAEQEKQRADHLAAKLRELNIDPENL